MASSPPASSPPASSPTSSSPTASPPASRPAVDWSAYAPAPEDAGLARLGPTERRLMLIDGELVEARDGRTFESHNPATGEVLATVPLAGDRDVTAAVASARRAYEEVWGGLDGRTRGRYLFRLARLVAERSRELAVVETLDNGKPIAESRDFDVPAAAAHLFSHAGWADKLHYLPAVGDAPHGVCAQIIPWNFPLLMAVWKIAPALVTGNTVVLKPAETTPLSALLLAECVIEAGLPAGVVNIITGDGDTGAALAGADGIDKLAFTGSTQVGRSIYAAAVRAGIPVTLELGGKSAHLVLADAAIADAVEGVVSGIFFNQGHVCCAGSRLLVAEAVAEELIARLKDRMATIRIGDPMDKNTDLGAVNSAEQCARIDALVASGMAEGATVWSPPGALGGVDPDGTWFPPTLVEGVSPSMRVAREEIFGPVLAVDTFRTSAEALEKANATPYGLAAGVWTSDLGRANALAAGLDAGVIWVNTYNRFDPMAAFGGFKESGVGREGGPSGLEAYRR